MDRNYALKKAKQILHESRIYDGVINLLKWDMMAYMPEAGRPWRVQSSTYLSAKRSELFITNESHALAKYLRIWILRSLRATSTGQLCAVF